MPCKASQMRFSCPSCSTEYEIPDTALAGRSRKLRCVRCGHEWRVGAEQTVPTARPSPDAHTHSWSPLPAEPEQNQAPAEPQADQPLPEAEAAPPPEPPAPDAAPAWPPIVEAADTPRQFGRPVDEAAHAEIVQAVEAEQKWTLPDDAPAGAKPDAEDGLPLFLTARGHAADAGPEAGDADQDRFAALIRAARNKAIEYEPEPKRAVPPINTSSPVFFGVLLLVFVIICVLLFEHRHIAHLFGGK